MSEGESSAEAVNALADADPDNLLTDIEAKVRRGHRLAPDARLLRAAEQLLALMTGEVARVTARADAGGWDIVSGDEVLGSVPDFADFDDMYDLLTSNARARLERLTIKFSKHADVAPLALPLTTGPRALHLALRLEETWRRGERTPSVMRNLVTASAGWLAGYDDPLQLADVAFARVFAVLALAKALKVSGLEHAEIILAHAMGYTQSAHYRTENLPPNARPRFTYASAPGDLDEAVLQHGYPRRLHIAPASSGHAGPPDDRAVHSLPSGEVSLPWLAYAAVTPATAQVSATPSPSVAEHKPHHAKGARRHVAHPAPAAHPASAVEAEQPTEAERRANEAHSRFPSSSALIGAMELRLKTLEGGDTTALVVSGSVQAAFWRSLFYRGLCDEVQRLRRVPSLRPALQAMVRDLGKPTAELPAAFASWAKTLSAFDAGELAAAKLLSVVVRPSMLGGAPVFELIDTYIERSIHGDLARDQGLASFVGRLDARPAHRALLGQHVLDIEYDQPQAERLHTAAVAASPDQLSRARLWLIVRRQDIAGLRAVLAEPQWEPADRAQMLAEAARAKLLPAAELNAAYDELARKDGNSWPIYANQAALLESMGQMVRARAQVERWLASDASHDAAARGAAVAYLAHLMQRDGDLSGARRRLLAANNPYHAAVIDQLALIELALHNNDRALEVAHFGVQRYPTRRESLCMLLRVLWATAEYVEAAQLLASPPSPLNLQHVRAELGQVFVDVFGAPAGRAPAKAVDAAAAIAAFERAKVDPWVLRELAIAAVDAGQPALGFELARTLHVHGNAMLQMSATAYLARKRSHGQAAALRWIRQEVPAPAFAPLSAVAFADGHDELLWDAEVDRSIIGERRDRVWMHRAAAWARAGRRDDAQRKRLAGYLRERSKSPYATIAKYFMGRATDRDLIALGTDAKSACEVAYYLGLRAQLDADLLAAARWYRTSVATGERALPEHQWSRAALARWRTDGTIVSEKR